MRISARVKEIREFDRLFASGQSEFIAVYGRRRVGKTYLVRNYFRHQDCLYFELSGQKNELGEPASIGHQIGNFKHAWRKAFGEEIEKPANWDEAFYVLKTKIDSIASDKKIVIFFDELPWLCTPKSRFYENLDQAWNACFEVANNVKLIVCGSASTWILKKIVHAKAGLSRRITQKIRLAPFTLAEVKDYLHFKNIQVTNDSITDIYMITGGIPYYLNIFSPHYSVYENIDNQLFSRDGHLSDEYDLIFDSLFSNSRQYKRVVEILAEKRQGLSLEELQKQFNPQASVVETSLSRILDNLYECDFVNKRIPLYNRKKGMVYFLMDEFVYFYHKWMKTYVTRERNSFLFRQSIMGSQAYVSWQGFSFEMLCMKHLQGIRRGLGIDKIASTAGFLTVYDPETGKKSAQIDLLFDRADKTITICEIKHHQGRYELTKADIASMKRKRDALLQYIAVKRKPVKNINYAFITLHGLKRNQYFHELEPAQVVLEDLFLP